LIKQRLKYLAGTLPYTTPLAKHMLYRALASTPELTMLSALEGHEHHPLTQKLPWGLTTEAQVAIRRIHTSEATCSTSDGSFRSTSDPLCLTKAKE
jgi:hypothetical protein